MKIFDSTESKKQVSSSLKYAEFSNDAVIQLNLLSVARLLSWARTDLGLYS